MMNSNEAHHDQVDRPKMPARNPQGHKGTFGTVGVIGGQCGAELMIGGPAFSAMAALRSGCGLAMVVAPRPVLPAILTVVPEATGLPIHTGEDPR